MGSSVRLILSAQQSRGSIETTGFEHIHAARAEARFWVDMATTEPITLNSHSRPSRTSFYTVVWAVYVESGQMTTLGWVPSGEQLRNLFCFYISDNSSRPGLTRLHASSYAMLF